MKFLRVIFLFVVRFTLIVILFGIILAVYIYASAGLPRYFLERPNDVTWTALDQKSKKVSWHLSTKKDFTAINDVNWTHLCLFGGYTHPWQEFKKEYPLGLPSWSSIRTAILTYFLRIEEYDMSVVLVDRGGVADAFYFRTGSPETQHFRSCFRQ